VSIFGRAKDPGLKLKVKNRITATKNIFLLRIYPPLFSHQSPDINDKFSQGPNSKDREDYDNNNLQKKRQNQ
jgi:hypothetical protein